jgi:DNA-binding PadR family transcriptional regulator
MLRYVLLALMADGQPTHGYALMKAYAERSGVRLSIGNIYRELQRLVDQGLITTAVNPVGADPRRAPYTITERGREVLAGWLAEPARNLTRTVPDELSHRLALVGDMEMEQAAKLLDDLQAELWERAKTVERERAIASQRRGQTNRLLSTRVFLLTRHSRHLAADIELVDEMRTRIAEARGAVGMKSASTSAAPERKRARSTKQKSRVRG